MYSEKILNPRFLRLACLSLVLASPLAFGQMPGVAAATEPATTAEPASATPPTAPANPSQPATPAAAAADSQSLVDADGTFKAVWKPQSIDFTYQSFTSLYSCDTFTSKIKLILTNLGAREDLKVRLRGCEPLNSSSFDRSGNFARSAVANQTLRARIEVSAPVVATPEALAELDKGKSQRELLVRARGKRPEDAIQTEQFQAGMQRVALSADSGDCQLVEQLRDQVLPKLGIRIVENKSSCIPGKFGANEMRLEVEALVAAPRADDAVTPTAQGFAPK
jgi:hypothetical protein